MPIFSDVSDERFRFRSEPVIDQRRERKIDPDAVIDQKFPDPDIVLPFGELIAFFDHLIDSVCRQTDRHAPMRPDPDRISFFHSFFEVASEAGTIPKIEI